jgi:hypothetical protein
MRKFTLALALLLTPACVGVREKAEGFDQDCDHRPISAVPEPTTIALCGTGLAGVIIVGLRRRKNPDLVRRKHVS